MNAEFSESTYNKHARICVHKTFQTNHFQNRKIYLILLVCLITCSSPPTKKNNAFEKDKSSEKKHPMLGACVSGDCWNGKGTFEYLNKDRYIGEFKDGLPNGEGLLIFSNGSSIYGSFQNGKVHGFATELDEKRRLIYSGEWVQGQKKTGL